MDEREYRAHPAINWSKLKSGRVSAKKLRYDLDHERSDQLSLRLGRAVHMFILEPETTATRFAVYEGSRRGKAWEAFAAENAGKEIVTTTEWERIKGCVRAVREHPMMRQHLVGAAEQVLFWTDAETGLACKGRVDLINGRLRDLKTAVDITPHRFAAAAVRFGYAGQQAFYQRGLRANGYDLHKNPVLLAVESEPPHDGAVYFMPDDVLEYGDAEVSRLLRMYADCLASGKWPGIAEDRELDLRLPAWADPHEDDNEPITIGGVALSL